MSARHTLADMLTPLQRFRRLWHALQALTDPRWGIVMIRHNRTPDGRVTSTIDDLVARCYLKASAIDRASVLIQDEMDRRAAFLRHNAPRLFWFTFDVRRRA